MTSMSRDAGLHRTTLFSAAFAVAIFSLAVVAHCFDNNSEVNCSRICVAENCNSVGIRYGKYCGVGWTGCPGEQPCDDLDACCKIHDDCVGNKGMTDIKCHEKFKRCIKKVHKSGNVGFSKQCPYDTAVPTMVYPRSGTKRKLGLQASEIKTNSSSLFAYFNSDDSESEEDLPRKISTSNAHLNTNIS